MKLIRNYAMLIALLFMATLSFAQEDTDTDDEAQQQKSNIQQYTPSKLIGKGQWDLKWFNNLYTQTESTFTDGEEPRQTFFTATLEAYTGVGENKRWNVGTILRFRSNVINDRGALDVFSFDGEEGTARSGLTAIAPSVKFVPFASVSNFSIQSSLFIPLIDNETENGVFLEQNGFVFQNRFFYDYTFPGDKWQLFTELTTELNFGDEEESFANNSLNLNPGLFLSYFPSSKFTVLVLAQHLQRIDLGNDFEQDFTALGGGVKYQLTKALNIEALYTNFVRGSNTGLGETFNIGLRAIF
ncbi:MAG: transporter [Saonia sp.]